jgi:hypothetical protein
MINHGVARSLVLGQLSVIPVAFPDDAWIILDEHTIERPWGWVFFFSSRRYVETADLQFAIAGNGPFFVRRTDGAVFQAGTALPVEDYLRNFEAGDERTVVKVE